MEASALVGLLLATALQDTDDEPAMDKNFQDPSREK